MTFRNNLNNNNNNNRRNNLGGGNSGNFDRNYGGTISRNVNPWDAGNNNNSNNNNNNNNMRGVGGGGNNDALALANNLLSNLLRNQNHQNVNVPSLLDMAQRGPYDGGYDNRNNNMGGGGYDDHRFRPMGNRGIGPGRPGGRNNNNNMRRNNVGPQNKQMGIRKPNAVARSKNILAKNSNNSKSDPTNDHQKKNDDLSMNGGAKVEGVKDGKRKFSPYADVPNDMFYCHLCTKHMWDSVSFENHLKGRTHQMMKEGVEESYRLKANMLRQEAKISEQLKSIEIDRLKRLGKAIRAANQNREYCTMCDLQFYGHLSTHRKSDGHLILKKFLHPKCEECNTEFHNRTEYDDHLLSPGHMKTSKTPPSYKSDESKKRRLHILTEVDELLGLREEKPKKEKKDPAKEGETVEGEEKKLNENGEPMETEVKEEEIKAESAADKQAEEDDNEQLEEKEDKPEVEPILDYTEGDEIVAEIESKIPKYNCKRAVGVSLITKLTCFECRLCNKYFDTDITSEIHSRTFNHHRMFVRFLNEKANETKIAQKRAAAAQLEETDRLKRQKVETEKTAENGTVPKSELYDPLTCTEDKEDIEKTDEPMPAKIEESVITAENGQKEDVEMKVEDPKIEAPVSVPATPEKVTPAVTPSVTPAVTPVVTPSSTPTKQNNQRGRGRGRARGRYGRY